MKYSLVGVPESSEKVNLGSMWTEQLIGLVGQQVFGEHHVCLYLEHSQCHHYLSMVYS